MKDKALQQEPIMLLEMKTFSLASVATTLNDQERY
jgi:hypothetical protein